MVSLDFTWDALLNQNRPVLFVLFGIAVLGFGFSQNALGNHGPAGDHCDLTLNPPIINVDYSYCDLSNADLRNANLTGANLTGAILHNTAFLSITCAEGTILNESTNQCHPIDVTIICGIDTVLQGDSCVVSQEILDQITTLQSDLATALSDLAQAEIDRDQALSDLADALSDIVTLQGDLTQTLSDLTTALSDLVTLEADLVAANDQITSLQNDLDTANEEITELTTIIQSGDITICHNEQTNTIFIASWGAHLNHGDAMGICE